MTPEPVNADGSVGPAAWTTLLASCVRLAQHAAALPANDGGERWRRSMPAIVGLHAVIQASGMLDSIAAAERSGAAACARVLLARYGADLAVVWAGTTIPESIAALISEGAAVADALASGRNHDGSCLSS